MAHVFESDNSLDQIVNRIDNSVCKSNESEGNVRQLFIHYGGIEKIKREPDQYTL